jgi:hypothetical protein
VSFECRFAECCYAECRYAECRNTEVRGARKRRSKNNKIVLIKKQETDKQGQELLRRRTGDCFLGAIWYMFGRGPYDEIVNFFIQVWNGLA